MGSDLQAQEERLFTLRSQLPAGVRLLAVSKGHPADPVRQLAGLGQLDFGESRVQEALPKQAALGDLDNLRWHFIGRLQANKVRPVVKSFSVIHSIDSLALAQRVDRIASEEGVRPDGFLQVKLRPDPSKGGWDPGALAEAWPELQALTSLRIGGLMAMAPQGLDGKARRSLFRECRTLADRMNLSECSMGMSGDWRDAAEEGATWVRVGSALFGPRPVTPGVNGTPN